MPLGSPTLTHAPESQRRSRLGARAVPESYAGLAAAAASLTVVSVVLLWGTNHGVSDLGASRSLALVSLGRLSGLLSADLLLLQVLLIARVPFVERAFGQDALLAWHRIVGFTSFTLLGVHILLTTIGYTVGGPIHVIKEFIHLVLKYPGMMLALVASLALIMVVVTSLRAARKKLRYESWHLLHLYAYLGVGLAIPHEVWTGTSFRSSRLATVYWWSLYAIAAGAILVYRVAVPIWRSRRHRLVVARVVKESPGVVSVHLRGHELDQLPVAAGQFFTFRFMDGAGFMRGHPFSLSAAPRADQLRITVKDLGDGSRRISRLKPGTKVWIEGPFGRLHGGTRTRRRVTLMASGIGITPLRALAESMPYDPGELNLIYRVHRDADVTFRRELDELARIRGAKVFYVVGPRLRGRTSWLPESAGSLGDVEALRRLVPDIADHDVYLCGAEGWMAAAASAAERAGVPPEFIHTEKFGW